MQVKMLSHEKLQYVEEFKKLSLDKYLTEDELSNLYASIEGLYEDWEIMQYYETAKKGAKDFSEEFRKSLTDPSFLYNRFATEEEKKQFNEGLNEYIRKM